MLNHVPGSVVVFNHHGQANLWLSNKLDRSFPTIEDQRICGVDIGEPALVLAVYYSDDVATPFLLLATKNGIGWTSRAYDFIVVVR